ALEFSLALDAGAAQGVGEAVGGVDAIEVARHLAAQETARNRMFGIAAQTHGAAVFHFDFDRAGVGAVVSADGVELLSHSSVLFAIVPPYAQSFVAISVVGCVGVGRRRAFEPASAGIFVAGFEVESSRPGGLPRQ